MKDTVDAHSRYASDYEEQFFEIDDAVSLRRLILNLALKSQRVGWFALAAASELRNTMDTIEHNREDTSPCKMTWGSGDRNCISKK